ncbi:hypothetical protein GCM10020000_46780 [Streptomyces olivoverticillatus]
MGPVDVRGRLPDAGAAPGVRPDQPLHREERHLSVVGDRAAPPVGGDVVAYALRPVSGTDLLQGVELDARAERVPDGTAEQAAAHPAAEILLFGPAPQQGTGCFASPRSGESGHVPASWRLSAYGRHSTVIDRS